MAVCVMSINSLLTIEEMYKADALTIDQGTPGIVLMENAGAAIAHEIMERWSKREVAVLCGPGNNGGDGFVAARLLSEFGWPVRLFLLGNLKELVGDAAMAAARWSGEVQALSAESLAGAPLVLDALFGAGLSRSLSGVALEIVKEINDRDLDCVAVDVPSGVQGDTGQILGDAPQCRLTVTFFRAKPAHVLMPARMYLGELIVADIGIAGSVLNDIKPTIQVNGPALWADTFPRPDANAHKFQRGHLLIAGGDDMTGAALLAARGARRIGAGLVSIAASPETWSIYASDMPGNLVRKVPSYAEFDHLLSDNRITAAIIGPGFGLGKQTREWVLGTLKSKKPVVLDADGISAFADNPSELFDHLHDKCVLTPHEGEFSRIFDTKGDKISRARRAAKRANACVLLKGPDTVIATPSNEVVINRSGTPYLATAGSGDVLSGLIGGLMAQGMVPFQAACAAAWSHGAVAETFGPGLIAEDIPDGIPQIARGLINKLVMTS